MRERPVRCGRVPFGGSMLGWRSELIPRRSASDVPVPGTGCRVFSVFRGKKLQLETTKYTNYTKKELEDDTLVFHLGIMAEIDQQSESDLRRSKVILDLSTMLIG